MSTLYQTFKNTAEKFPKKTAIVFYGKHITFESLLLYIDTFASNLKQFGLKAGDVATVCLPNNPSAAVVTYAINKVGAICNLVHPFVPVEQLKQSVNQTNSKILVTYDIYKIKNGDLPFDIPIYMSDSGYFLPTPKKLFFHLRYKTKKHSYKSLESCFLGKFNQFPAFEFDDTMPAIFLPSGGTTGDPKIIMHNCNAFNFVISDMSVFLSAPVQDYQSMYSVLPVFHGFGLCMGLHLPLTHAITLVMGMKFNAKHISKCIPKYKVGFMIGVPTIYKRLLDSKHFKKANLSPLRECFVGGDTVHDSLTESFNKALKSQGSKGKLLTGYGLTEAVSVCAVNSLKKHKHGSLGFPIPKTEFCILKDGKVQKANQEGEILINCPMLMLGYYQNQENSKQNQIENPSDDLDGQTAEQASPIRQFNGKMWLFTGDCGYLDSDGCLYFKQRLKNILKVNGVLVFPSEIEKLMDGIDGVKMSCAISVADEKRGESVKLFVQAEQNVDKKALEAKIVETAKQKLIVYARPREICFLEEFPMSNIGKIDRKKLRQL